MRDHIDGPTCWCKPPLCYDGGPGKRIYLHSDKDKTRVGKAERDLIEMRKSLDKKASWNDATKKRD